MNPTTTMDAPMIATLNGGDNTYGAGANGISILEDVLTTPNGITLNSVGISYDSGTTITSTTWDDISTRVAALSAIAPNGLNATLLAVVDTISIQNADTAPTRVINTQAGDTTGGTHFGVAWVGNTLPFVMETLDATNLQIKDTTLELNDSVTPLLTTMTASTLTSGASSASWATIIAGGASIGTLDGVLATGNTATGTYATITLTDTDVGGQANPILTLNNTNATGSVGLEVYKNKPTAGVAGDVLFNQSVYGKDSFLNKQEYTRITHTLRDGTGGVEDGSIEFGCFVNGSFNNFLQINGNENEVNCLKTLDMGGNTITTKLNDMTIATTASTGTGNLTITAKGNLTETGNSVAITSVGTAGDAITLTSAGNINLIPNATTGIIKTDRKITTLTDPTGCSIDFGGATADYNFTISKDIIDLNYNNTITAGNQQLFQDPVSEQAFFRQQFTTSSNMLETLIRNDINSNSIKLSETATTSNCEITKDGIDVVDGAGLTITLSSSGLTSTGSIGLTAVGDITLTPTNSVVISTQIQMPTTSGTISYNAITGSLDIDFIALSTGYFELSNISPVSISSFTLTNGRIGGEYHILLRGPSGFSYVPTPSASFKANNYSIITTNGDEWVGLKIYFTNTLSQYLVNATLYA